MGNVGENLKCYTTFWLIKYYWLPSRQEDRLFVCWELASWGREGGLSQARQDLCPQGALSVQCPGSIYIRCSLWGSHPQFVVEKGECNRNLDNGEISLVSALLETSVLEKYCPAIEVRSPEMGGVNPKLNNMAVNWHSFFCSPRVTFITRRR